VKEVTCSSNHRFPSRSSIEKIKVVELLVIGYVHDFIGEEVGNLFYNVSLSFQQFNSS
jgi:hypothetical protein